MLFIILLYFYSGHSISLNKLNSDDHWEEYKKIFNFNFGFFEDRQRRTIFLDNYKYIQEHNHKESLFKMGINHLTHLVLFKLN